MFPDYFRDDVFRLETQRLWLRWPAAADAATIERLAGEREIAEFAARIPHPYPRGAAEGFVLAARKANSDGIALHLALALRQKPSVAIGMVSLEGAGDTLEIGYWLGEPYWGHGIATEAVAAVTEFAFANLPIHRVHACVFEGNAASARVLEKNGYVLEGRMRRRIEKDGQILDELVYGILR